MAKTDTVGGAGWQVDYTWYLHLELAKFGPPKFLTFEKKPIDLSDCLPSGKSKTLSAEKQLEVQEALRRDIRGCIEQAALNTGHTDTSFLNSPRSTSLLAKLAEAMRRNVNSSGQITTEKDLDLLMIEFSDSKITRGLAAKERRKVEKNERVFRAAVSSYAKHYQKTEAELMDVVAAAAEAKVSRDGGAKAGTRILGADCRFSLKDGAGKHRAWTFSATQLEEIVRDGLVVEWAAEKFGLDLLVSEPPANTALPGSSGPRRRPKAEEKKKSSERKFTNTTQRHIDESLRKGHEKSFRLRHKMDAHVASAFPAGGNDKIGIKKPFKREPDGSPQENLQRLLERAEGSLMRQLWKLESEPGLSHELLLAIVAAKVRPSTVAFACWGTTNNEDAWGDLEATVRTVVEDLQDDRKRARSVLAHYAAAEKDGHRLTDDDDASLTTLIGVSFKAWANSLGVEPEDLQGAVLGDRPLFDHTLADLARMMKTANINSAAGELLGKALEQWRASSNRNIDGFLTATRKYADSVAVPKRLQKELEAKVQKTFGVRPLKELSSLGGVRMAVAQGIEGSREENSPVRFALSNAAMILKYCLEQAYRLKSGEYETAGKLDKALGIAVHFISEWVEDQRSSGSQDVSAGDLDKESEHLLSMIVCAARDFEQLDSMSAEVFDRVALPEPGTGRSGVATDEEAAASEVGGAETAPDSAEPDSPDNSSDGSDLIPLDASDLLISLDSRDEEKIFDWTLNRWVENSLYEGYIGATKVGYANGKRKLEGADRSLRKSAKAKFRSAADIDSETKRQIIDCAIEVLKKQPITDKGNSVVPTLQLDKQSQAVRFNLGQQARNTVFMRDVAAAVELVRKNRTSPTRDHSSRFHVQPVGPQT